MNSKNKHLNVKVGNETQYEVYTLINKNQNITHIELSKNIKKSEEIFRRNIKSLVKLKLSKRIGSYKTGRW